MSIHIQHPHNKPQAQARALAEQVASQLKQEFAVDYRWEGEVLHFQRSGVAGKLTVAPEVVTVEAKLGFLLMAVKPTIEAEIRKFLTQHFG